MCLNGFSCSNNRESLGSKEAIIEFGIVLCHLISKFLVVPYFISIHTCFLFIKAISSLESKLIPKPE
jgi:hypothetical protein